MVCDSVMLSRLKYYDERVKLTLNFVRRHYSSVIAKDVDSTPQEMNLARCDQPSKPTRRQLPSRIFRS